jgi:hypothetical protein
MTGLNTSLEETLLRAIDRPFLDLFLEDVMRAAELLNDRVKSRYHAPSSGYCDVRRIALVKTTISSTMLHDA